MIQRIHLLVIDPQNDFCDLHREDCPSGLLPALPVSGADNDMRRLAHFLSCQGLRIDAITVTLDSHHRYDIAHPSFWSSPSGSPSPFTTIGLEDVNEGLYRVVRSEDEDRARGYLRALAKTSVGRHTIWPVHCQIGTWGNAIHIHLQRALDHWEDTYSRMVEYVRKGENPYTEHFSAVHAQVPDLRDAATQTNWKLVESLRAAESVWIAGEASSHCVRATVEDLVAAGVEPLRMVLLRDAMSAVAGFEGIAQDFLMKMEV